MFAIDLGGTVTNGTTGKPAAGVQLTLLSLSTGMQPIGNAVSDSRGHYSLTARNANGMLLLRASFEGANYHQRVTPGESTVDITVYNAAEKVDNILGEGRILRVQTSGGELEVSEMFSLRNESRPPRTQTGDHSFEFSLPEGATISEGMAKGPGGMPITSAPIPLEQKNRYGFVFPLRPGLTQFQVIYKLPYKGSREFNITTDMPLAELGVMLPAGMSFKDGGGSFGKAGDEAGMAAYVAKGLTAGQTVKFTLSGEGRAPNAEDAGAASPTPGGSGMGGPGQPETEASGKVSMYMILCVLLIIFGGGFFALRRKKTAQTDEDAGPPRRSLPASGNNRSAPARTQKKSRTPGTVLDALKEDLFQLESDRLDGKISQQEYDKAKAGLDLLLRRQMK